MGSVAGLIAVLLASGGEIVFFVPDHNGGSCERRDRLLLIVRYVVVQCLACI